MKSRRIVIADRDPKFCEALSEQFELQQNYACQTFTDATSALAEMDGEGVDILLIDSCLPDMSLRSFNEALRAKDADVPVIFMLRANDEEDEESLSDLAGDHDVFMRPFRFVDLLTLVKFNLRAHETHQENDILIGPYRFRHVTKLLIGGGEGEAQKIRLTEKEADILKYLSDEEGKVVSREVLLAEVWGYNSGVTTHTLETHIYRLRQKIERDPSNAEHLVTEAGGYRLVR